MAKRKGDSIDQPPNSDKSEDLLPPGREPVHQGQQFDEMQRQQKNPDGTPQREDSGVEG